MSWAIRLDEKRAGLPRLVVATDRLTVGAWLRLHPSARVIEIFKMEDKPEAAA